ncbi:pyridoxal-phosphate dependent enzyme [Phototrophicus methaneseepsis]|uniref:Pyridoxal-phosphate dependent enzyme n=1 Tax=Phototrophicus methaneseepsis TaxID=2710758 RepID=A0A7S8IEB8_9CHLR|nr:pyridoxal-phosphate dependent enzyme [Phototrophicus methaneseepsis]QPC82407.1 pyridoxal-phosphate dependent enzyme [Phototrophicus methaneseepsis]
MTTIICTECGAQAQPLDWRCTHCGGPLDFDELPPFDAKAIIAGDFSLWRYRAMLPVKRRISLGEGLTPLAKTKIDGRALYIKQEYLNPTGSYKDRGTVTMMNHIAAQGVTEVVEDSSGNAGASVAAYSSAAGIQARIYVPESGSPAKKALIQAFGGTLVEVPGPQQAKTDACEKAAETTTYASHAWSPYFTLGQMTAAYELWEQFGKVAPDAIATPVGHGGLFLGLARGFRQLYNAGLVDKVPRMFAIQAANSDPIVRGWESGADEPVLYEVQPTVADGIIVKVPVRGKAVLSAIRESDGAALRVAENTIVPAQETLARHGFIAEPTSAVTLAALPQLREILPETASLVLVLTGNGLKNVER